MFSYGGNRVEKVSESQFIRGNCQLLCLVKNSFLLGDRFGFRVLGAGRSLGHVLVTTGSWGCPRLGQESAPG